MARSRTYTPLNVFLIRHMAFTLAMSVGATNHYRIDQIRGRHFQRSAAAKARSNG